MTNAEDTLQHYGATNDYTIHVVDSDPNPILADFNDVSQVEKYVMSDEDYAAREDSFRKYKQEKMAENAQFMNAHQ